jgi:hypothetical protein
MVYTTIRAAVNTASKRYLSRSIQERGLAFERQRRSGEFQRRRSELREGLLLLYQTRLSQVYLRDPQYPQNLAVAANDSPQVLQEFFTSD